MTGIAMGIGIGAVRPMAAFKPFLPSDSAALALWLRADTTSYNTGTTQATDAQTLSSWLDSVGSKSFAQATAGNRPRYGIVESVPMVRFAGANRTNCMVYTNKVFGNDIDFTISLAVRVPRRNTVTATFYSECNSADTSDLFTISVGTTGLVRVAMRDSADHVVNFDSLTAIDDNLIHIVTVTIVGGFCKIYIDGVLELNSNYATTVTGWPASTTFNRTTLGARTSTTTTSYLAGDIFEVVGYSTSLDAATMALHHGYMLAKYASAIVASELCGHANGSPLYSQAIYKASQNKTFIGSFDSNKSAQITVINHGVSPATVNTYVIADNYGSNRHNSVAIQFASDGKLMAFYDDHNTGVLSFAKSTNVGDATAFDAATDIGLSSMHAYPHAIQTTEGANSWRVYVFYRDQSVGAWKYRYTDDDGATWSTTATLWQPAGTGSVQIYGRVRLCSDGYIHFAFGSNDVTATGGSTDLYHWMYNPADGKWYKSDGATEITASQPYGTADVTKVYDSSSNGNRNPSFTGDIMTDVSGNIYIAIATDDQVSSHRLCRMVHNVGSPWALEEILTMIGDSDVSFLPADPHTIHYKDNPGSGRQMYTITYSAGAWGDPVVLTSGTHFSANTQGPSRVIDAEDGGPISTVWTWGYYDDDTSPYGQLMCYPAVT